MSGGRRVRRAGRRVLNDVVTRLKPALPPPGLQALRQASSLLGPGPALVVPAAERALVLAPHPDDETIGCGGTVAILTAAGTQVHVVIATDGGASIAKGLTAKQLQSRRRIEATRACQILGTPAPAFLGLPDGALGADLDLLARLLGPILREHRPDLVFVPWPLDGHPDHRALPAALARCDLTGVREVWGYEVWSALMPNRIVDVTASWPRKTAALAEHHSATAMFGTDAFLALQRWRSIHVLDGRGYSEAFLALAPADFRRSVTTDQPNRPWT